MFALRRLPFSAPRFLARPIQVSAIDLRVGDLIEFGENLDLHKVEKQQFSRQAQGRAFIQLEIRNQKTGKIRDVRMKSDESIEKAILDTPDRLQVLYFDKESMTLMHPMTFEQTEMPISILGDQAQYLHEGLTVTLEMYKGAPATVALPSRLTFEVVEVDSLPSGSVKENRDVPALLENGLRVRVPKHVKKGEKIILDTSDGKYVGKE